MKGLSMFAVLHVPHFPLQAVLRHAPELWSRPVALVDPGMTTPRVVEATPPAREAGVTDGLTAPQALARCRTVTIRHRVPAQEATAAEAMLQCAYGFSPHLEATGLGMITLDLRGLAVLKTATATATDGGANENERVLQAWGERLRLAVAALGMEARVGLGSTPNVARHAARWGALGARAVNGAEVREARSPSGPAAGPERGTATIANDDAEPSAVFRVQVVTDPAAFVAGLPVVALEPSSDVVGILQRWGIRTVGELLALGQAELAERLGLEALGLFAAASVTSSRPLKLVKPAERFEETHEFDVEVETAEPLLFLLRRFTESLVCRLDVFGWVAGELRLRIRLESGRVLEQSLRVPQPTRRADVLFRMLHTHLESLRTESPVKSVTLVVEPTRPEQRQFGLFESALRDPNQFQETLARLAALVGADRVGTPVREDSHRTDAFVLVPPDFEREMGIVGDGTGESGERDGMRPVPLRRLRPAVTAQVDVEAGRSAMPTPEGRPLAVQCAVANGRLVVTLGPWRSSGQWWEAGGWEREEWDVSMRGGRVVRLVRVGATWAVEGVLD